MLLCLVLFSMHMTGGLYARYTASESASSGARVAKFDITNQIDSKPVDVDLNFYDPNKLSDVFTFTVASGSEVAVKYDVVVTLPAGHDYGWLIITLDGEEPTDRSDNVYTFRNVHSFAPATDLTQTHTMRFAIEDAYVGNSQGMTNILDGVIILTVHAEQID